MAISKSWIAGWLALATLMMSVAAVGVQAQRTQYAIGFIPVEAKTSSFPNAVDLIKRRWGWGSKGGDVGAIKEKKAGSIDAIKTVDQVVSYCNNHPHKVNTRLYELKRYVKQEHGKKVSYPSARSQGHILTYDGKKAKITFIMEDKKFQKVVKGFTGDNVYGKVESKEQFFVKEVRLFLKGKFKKAERLAKINYGRKYTYKPSTQAMVQINNQVLSKLMLSSSIEGLAVSIGFLSRKGFTLGTIGISGVSLLAPFTLPILPVFGLLNSAGLLLGHNKLQSSLNLGRWGKIAAIGASVIVSIAVAIII